MSGELTHLDAKGQAQMVDVSQKQASDRTAIAEGRVVMSPETFQVVLTGQAKKGDVLGVARLAGIMAAKRTSDLIPLCHPLPLAKVAIDLEADAGTHSIHVVATAKVSGQTGVEMEALTAVSVACLTVYDMVKAVDKGMRIEGIRLLEKTGGKSGTYQADK